MVNINQEDLLIRYFEGSLNEEEQRYFDELLISDLAFKKRFEEEQLIRSAVILSERQRIKGKLKSFDSNSNRRVSARWWPVAAVLAGLAVAVWWWTGSANQPDDLFEKHFRPYPNMIAPAVRSNNDTSLKFRAMLAYDREQYQNAVPLLKELYHLTQNDTVLLYQAISEIKTGKREAALIRLEAIRLNDSLYRPATWYAALGYLASGKKKKATSLVQQLAETPDTFSDQAAGLLRDLR